MANRKYPYEKMELEYVASDDGSIGNIVRRLNITNESLVYDYARRHQWAHKRKMRMMRTDDKRIELLGDRMAVRQAKLEDLVDETIGAIGDAINKIRRDLQDPLSETAVTPRDLALLVDRILVLRGQPSQIIEERNLGLSLSGTVRPEQLTAILELTRGVPASDGRGSRGPAFPRAEDARNH